MLANHRRGSGRRIALADRLRTQIAGAVAEHPDPAETAEVRDAVAALPADRRELVVLVHRDGFSITEAAQLLDVNPSTARTRYGAARERLARALTGVLTGVQVL